MTEATYFVHKQGLSKTKGVPISAMLQCRKPLEGNERFYLYECQNGNGFFLRGIEEFHDRFLRYGAAKNREWTHKTKGGVYKLIDTFLYVGSPSLGASMDGEQMKAYYMAHTPSRGLFCPAKQFRREFEARYVVKWMADEATLRAMKERLPQQGDLRETEHGPTPEGFASTEDCYKGIITDEGFVTVYKEDGQPLYNALVSREGCKDVRVRGEDLGLVMSAARALLHGK